MGIRLTDQQQAIVDHNDGPALVFAVAGAGKTTAAVHRIERLVRQHRFAPEKILATSFSRATVEDLQRALDRWPSCARVSAKTLHGLGFGLIRRAIQRGYLHSINLDRDGDREGLPRQLLYQTLAVARKRQVDYVEELETLDHEDFLSYLSRCKGNLEYADLEGARLPQQALRVARQAAAPTGFDWYLDLYQLFEEVRAEGGQITFDDMLVLGWETLIRHPDLLAQAQGLFECVLVDEFQDVNLVQSEILDLITARHRNYMAIGDDDQTIYEWRGADSQFILNFEQRYRATKYLITDNFRCPAAQLVLANEVIRHNRQREPKRLNLTRGFDGQTCVHAHDDSREMGRAIVGEIQAALADGFGPDEITVLVRIYAQTAPIEQALIEARIPYEVVGSMPFYQRPEVTTLLNYCRIALLDRTLAAGRPLTDEQVAEFATAWNNIYNQPKRYLSKDLSTRIGDTVIYQTAPLSRVLIATSASAPRENLAARLVDLAADIKWLAANLDGPPADQVLRTLEERLGYLDHLRRSSGFAETGEGKAASVEAFIEYARGKGSLVQFLKHLDYISVGQVGRPKRGEPRVTLRTIFRAKGLEWPIVLVPDCNDGTIPFRAADREEERRLLYVAITRSKRFLHLYHLRDKPISPFLREARHSEVLANVRTLRDALARDPETWHAPDCLAVVKYTRELHLRRYFQEWWNAPPQHKIVVASVVQRFLAAARRRNIFDRLGLQTDDETFWRSIAPLPPESWPTDFPGLDFLLPRHPAPRPILGRSSRPSSGGLSSRPGDRVHHNHYGWGVITRVDEDGLLTVKFETWGEKKMRWSGSDLAKA